MRYQLHALVFSYDDPIQCQKVTVQLLIQACKDPEGGKGGPDPQRNHKNIGFLSNTGLDPLKITKLPSQPLQCRAIIGMLAKRHLNGV